jgi:hypothetical protein
MRRHSRVARAALLVGLVWAAGACSDGLTDINNNPNAPTSVPVEFLLPTAIQGAVEAAYGSWQLLSHTSIWPQHTVQIQYPDEERGLVRPGNMDGFWAGYYTGPLKDIQTVIDVGVETDHVNAQAVGLIWKSWVFHIITDYWGDVPYSEALSGETNVTPAYDPQAEVYGGMLADLTTAVGLLNPNAQTFGEGDLIYGSDMEAWRKFANSLRMRLAMRMSEADGTTARSQFQAAYAAGGFTGNADNAFLDFPGAPYENPLYENYLERDDHAISMTMVDTLQSLNDPRLFLYAEPAVTDGQYRGHANGRQSLPAGQSLGDISRIGNFWRANGANTPATIMTYSEVLFLQAEAVARGWISGDASALYMAAIEANMNQYDPYGVGPSDAEIAAYLAQPRVAYAGINSIHLQKWISLYMTGPEAWSDVRRTNVPQLIMGPDLLISMIPVRMSYPDTEQSLNKANLDAAISRQGGGLELTTKVWWDKN